MILRDVHLNFHNGILHEMRRTAGASRTGYEPPTSPVDSCKAVSRYLNLCQPDNLEETTYWVKYHARCAFVYVNHHFEYTEMGLPFARMYVLSLRAWDFNAAGEAASFLRLLEGTYDQDLERGVIPYAFSRAREANEFFNQPQKQG